MIHYICCQSYEPLYFVIYLKSRGNKVVVFTTNNNVKKYCKFSGIDSVLLPSPTISQRSPFKIFQFKRKVNSIIKNLEINKNDKFYFFDNVFAIEGFYLAKKFNQKCKIFNLNMGSLPPYQGTFCNLNGFKHIIGKIIIKIILGIPLVFKEKNKKPVYGINDKFFRDYNIKKLDLKPNIEKIKLRVIKNNKIKLKKYRTLFAYQGLLDSDCIKKDSIIKLYNNLLSYDFDLVIKEHPYFKDSEDFFKNIPKYPDYIPVELLFNNIKKNVISIYSISLAIASKLKKIKAISLLELVEWQNESFKQKMKKMLMERSNNKIIFVKDFNELKKLLTKNY